MFFADVQNSIHLLDDTYVMKKSDCSEFCMQISSLYCYLYTCIGYVLY